jgi:hypothetical protein
MDVPTVALDAQFVGGPDAKALGHQVEVARPSLSEAAAARQALGVQSCSGSLGAPAVTHVAVQTEDMDPAEILLEYVFRLWMRIGYSHSSDLTGVEIDRPNIDMGHFLQKPPIVQLALKLWLRDGVDLPASAAAVPMLALWFRDAGLPLPAEEAKFLDQWLAYVDWCRRWKRRG